MTSNEDINVKNDLEKTDSPNNDLLTNKDLNNSILYMECNKSGYDFFGYEFQLPGEICIDIFEYTGQFKEKEWYTHDRIYELSGGILYNIWLDPDNPNGVIYIDFKAYDHNSVIREIIQVYINEIRYSGKISILKFLEESNEKSNIKINNKPNDEIIIKENIIFNSPFTRTELDERFIYSRLFLGYDYELNFNEYEENYFKLLPVKDKVLSLKKLSIRNIRLFIAKQLDLIKEINKSKIILKPVTLRHRTQYFHIFREWNPSIIQYIDKFIKDQPLFIKEMLELRRVPL